MKMGMKKVKRTLVLSKQKREREKMAKEKKKAGRKAKWTQTVLNDAVDIIIGK